ncbi:hypothetical protein M413DRAFT_26118 [Hebeloma cylindrosporum]|uniref:Uncharacterized protein n=1 Tax=Hebeloma cylindrosporum TaxID=76867 RepID=A0A0C2Y1U1_HEBCY|nr:hypothetical protein M413DRAFT_26118 [Hebeloma cylindrosporum h7]
MPRQSRKLPSKGWKRGPSNDDKAVSERPAKKARGNDGAATNKESRDAKGRECDTFALPGLGSLFPSSSYEDLELTDFKLDKLKVSMKCRCKFLSFHVILEKAERVPSACDFKHFGELACALEDRFTEAQVEDLKDCVRNGLLKDAWAAPLKHPAPQKKVVKLV